jgi:hypothetical protein
MQVLLIKPGGADLSTARARSGLVLEGEAFVDESGQFALVVKRIEA